MKNEPRVSVIMPLFDAERFLREAIESVLAQTHRNWELLLVDDGSQDGSRAIAHAYTDDFPQRIHIHEHPGRQNRGTSASRNLGLRHATGDYIALLDADDVYLPRKLEEQVALLEAQRGVSLLYGSTEYWYSWTGNPEDAARDHVPNVGVPPDRFFAPPRLVPLFVRREAHVPCTCSILVRHEAVQRVGGFEDRFRGMYDDQVWYMKLFLFEPAYVAAGVWDRYRRHPRSCYASAKRSGQTSAARRMFLQWLAEYLTTEGVTDAGVWRAVQDELRAYRAPLLYSLSRRARSLARRLSFIS